ncbi:MAG: helix-turn-helix transcriptional regulator [Phycisphaerales bacterium]|nr:helix-turn-helix domain-containing protein [Phycisphaerae bacterium]NNF41442.1 helix-turn-helix transcriptional regulator [Phycisphaerales bacterium]NNM26613.1 helix-turn-helix transcriptional regulator [Phycisphaerales bacterium]
MLDLCTIESPEAATAALNPLRNRLLGELDQPASAAGIATRLGIPRQKVNYHLRALERLGLATVVEERQWGGLTERLFVANASTFVISPAALGPIGADPARSRDRLSAGHLIALGARVVREVSDLVRRAGIANKQLATLSMDTTVRFRSPAERAGFTRELTAAVTQLVGKYHDPHAPRGRSHRVLVAAHPLPTPSREDSSCQ